MTSTLEAKLSRIEHELNGAIGALETAQHLQREMVGPQSQRCSRLLESVIDRLRQISDLATNTHEDDDSRKEMAG